MSEEWKKEFIDTLSKKFDVDMKRYEISDYILMSLFNMEQKKNKLQERIDKALKLLNDWEYLDRLDCYSQPKEVIDILRGEDKE